MVESSLTPNVLLETSVLELLASRICHDLISPVGAVHNGVEFLEEMGLENGAEAVGLIAHSAQIAAARLQIFRLAYGAGGRDMNIKPEDVHKTFAALLETDNKIVQDWNPHGPLGFDDRPPGFCKMLTGTMMLALECLPKGGKIGVLAGEPGQTLITAEGTETLVRERVEDALARALSPADLDPRLVHPYVMAVLAEQYGFSVKITNNKAGRVVFTLTALENGPDRSKE